MLASIRQLYRVTVQACGIHANHMVSRVSGIVKHTMCTAAEFTVINCGFKFACPDRHCGFAERINFRPNKNPSLVGILSAAVLGPKIHGYIPAPLRMEQAGYGLFGDDNMTIVSNLKE
jgi:hypothetical protein